MTRTPLSRSKGHRSRSPGGFSHRGVMASASASCSGCRLDRGKVLTVGTEDAESLQLRCAQQGAGIVWRPHCRLHSLCDFMLHFSERINDDDAVDEEDEIQARSQDCQNEEADRSSAPSLPSPPFPCPSLPVPSPLLPFPHSPPLPSRPLLSPPFLPSCALPSLPLPPSLRSRPLKSS